MGLEHYTYLILGRMCTSDEKAAIYKTMQNMDRDSVDFIDLNSFEDASVDTSIFTVFDANGTTKWPVVVYTFGSNYDGYWDREQDEYHFYVVEAYIHRRSDRWTEEDFNPLQNIPKPHDPRAGLLMVQDIG